MGRMKAFAGVFFFFCLFFIFLAPPLRYISCMHNPLNTLGVRLQVVSRLKPFYFLVETSRSRLEYVV